MIPTDIIEKARQIKLLAMDVDGVLTNGEIIYTDAKDEVKVFNVKDGHGLAMLVYIGFEVAIITGRSSVINQRRADELGIRHLFQGIKNKLPVLEALADQLGISLLHIAYIGDDTPDIPILKQVGLAVCPADAVEEVKRVCHYTTQASGGRGAVREITDLLMRSQNLLTDEGVMLRTPT